MPEFIPSNTASTPTSAKAPSGTGQNQEDSSACKDKATKGESIPRPKRPLSAYNLFFQERRQILLAKLPSSKKFDSLAKAIGAQWKRIGAEEKEEYERIARQGREDFNRRLEEWKEIQQKNGHSTKRFRRPNKKVVSKESPKSPSPKVTSSKLPTSQPSSNSLLGLEQAALMTNTVSPMPNGKPFRTNPNSIQPRSFPLTMNQVVQVPLGDIQLQRDLCQATPHVLFQSTMGQSNMTPCPRPSWQTRSAFPSADPTSVDKPRNTAVDPVPMTWLPDYSENPRNEQLQDPWDLEPIPL